MSYAKKIEAARKRENAARDAIYAAAYPRRDVLFRLALREEQRASQRAA